MQQQRKKTKRIKNRKRKNTELAFGEDCVDMNVKECYTYLLNLKHILIHFRGYTDAETNLK